VFSFLIVYQAFAGYKANEVRSASKLLNRPVEFSFFPRRNFPGGCCYCAGPMKLQFQNCSKFTSCLSN